MEKWGDGSTCCTGAPSSDRMEVRSASCRRRTARNARCRTGISRGPRISTAAGMTYRVLRVCDEVEEIVFTSGGAPSQQFGPHRGDGGFEGALGWGVRRALAIAKSGGIGEPGKVDLAIGGEWNRRKLGQELRDGRGRQT